MACGLICFRFIWLDFRSFSHTIYRLVLCKRFTAQLSLTCSHYFSAQPSCYWISWSWRHKVSFSSFGVWEYSCFVSVHGTPNIASTYQQMNLFSHIILILQYLRTDEFSFTLLNAKVSVVSITWTTKWRTYWLVQNIFFWVMKQKTQFWACGPCWESSLLTIVIF